MEDSKSRWIATDCTICYHSCGMNVLVEEGRVTKVQGLKDHPLNKGQLCPKGARVKELVYHPDRLKYPLKKVGGGWKRITWDIALTEIADKLQSLKKEFGPKSLSISSGSIGVENLEMMELAQRFKGAFGSESFEQDKPLSEVSHDSYDRSPNPLFYSYPASKHQRSQGEKSGTLCGDP